MKTNQSAPLFQESLLFSEAIPTACGFPITSLEIRKRLKCEKIRLFQPIFSVDLVAEKSIDKVEYKRESVYTQESTIKARSFSAKTRVSALMSYGQEYGGVRCVFVKKAVSS